ncbi:MAG: disulfide bond formation protein B [Sterolibacterium sp.]
MSPEQRIWYRVFGAWLIATSSTLGALFFGEFMKLPTCNLCWYQRIFMFPLAIMLAFALFPLDTKIKRYSLPLAIAGWCFAGYHQLVVAGVIPEALRPCTQGVPCSTTVAEWFGFLTIPMLSLIAFSSIIALLLFPNQKSSK